MNNLSLKLRKKPSLDKNLMIKEIIVSIILGLALGLLSKILDETTINELPKVLQVLDIGNFLSRMGIWLFIAFVIAIKSQRPLNASMNVFLFFLSMLISYYAYTILVAGFYPKNYIIIWLMFTLVSLILAYVCWYAKGEDTVAIIVSSLIVAMMLRQTFVFGWLYFDLLHITELFVFIASILVLYHSPIQIVKVSALGIIIYMISGIVIGFNGLL